MPLRVRHRIDRVLHELAYDVTTSGKWEDATPREQEDQIHPRLLKFVREELMKNHFESREELQKRLARWHAFAQEQGLPLRDDTYKLTAHSDKIRVSNMRAYLFCAVIVEMVSVAAPAEAILNM